MRTTTLHLCRALVVALFVLSSRTPSIASTTALGGETKKPKPSKRGLPAATVRATVASVVEKEGDEPPVHAAAALVVHPAVAPIRPEERGSDLTAPEYLRPYTPSHAGTLLSPPALPPASVL